MSGSSVSDTSESDREGTGEERWRKLLFTIVSEVSSLARIFEVPLLIISDVIALMDMKREGRSARCQ